MNKNNKGGQDVCKLTGTYELKIRNDAILVAIVQRDRYQLLYMGQP